MQILIKVEDDRDSAGELLPWLQEDPAAKLVELRSGPGRADEMGVGEVVQAVVENSIALSSVLVSIAAWRESRRRETSIEPQVRIETGDTRVTLQSGDWTDIERILRALNPAHELQPPEAPSQPEP